MKITVFNCLSDRVKVKEGRKKEMYDSPDLDTAFYDTLEAMTAQAPNSRDSPGKTEEKRNDC